MESDEMYRQIESGEKKFDDFTFEQRTHRGWMLNYLLRIESMFWGRWNYWTDTVMAGQLLDKPIPKIKFLPEYDPTCKDGDKMIRKCLDYGWNDSIYENRFFDWILWGFRDTTVQERPKIPEKINEQWYKHFNLGPLLEKPTDYFGRILAEQRYGRGSGFFPTPMNVVEMMTMMVLPQEGETRHLTVCDPAVGTGRMLLYASNYSFRLYGMDINYSVLKACLVNGWLYAPWMVMPFEGKIDWPDGSSAPPEPFEETGRVVLTKDDQTTMF